MKIKSKLEKVVKSPYTKALVPGALYKSLMDDGADFNLIKDIVTELNIKNSGLDDVELNKELKKFGRYRKVRKMAMKFSAGYFEALTYLGMSLPGIYLLQDESSLLAGIGSGIVAPLMYSFRSAVLEEE